MRTTYERERNKFTATIGKISGTSFSGYAVNSLCSAKLTDASNYEKDLKDEASKDNIFGYVHATNLAREGKNIVQEVITSFRNASCQLIDEEQRNLQRTIANVDSEVSNARPKDYDFIDMALSVAVLMGLLFLFLPGNIIGPVIVGIIILGFVTGGAILIVLLPPAKLFNLIRKMLWKSEASKAQSQKQILQHKISELQSVKNKIISFNVQE